MTIHNEAIRGGRRVTTYITICYVSLGLEKQKFFVLENGVEITSPTGRTAHIFSGTAGTTNMVKGNGPGRFVRFVNRMYIVIGLSH